MSYCFCSLKINHTEQRGAINQTFLTSSLMPRRSKVKHNERIYRTALHKLSFTIKVTKQTASPIVEISTIYILFSRQVKLWSAHIFFFQTQFNSTGRNRSLNTRKSENEEDSQKLIGTPFHLPPFVYQCVVYRCLLNSINGSPILVFRS